MIMSTKQEQEILDNAPDWATHFMTTEVDGFKTQYAKLKNGQYVDEVLMPFTSYWTAHHLSSLRKMQYKTVVDAVNHFNGVLPVNAWPEDDHNCHTVNECIKSYREYCAKYFEGMMCAGGSECDKSVMRIVCTREEFKQCVAAMIFHAGYDEYIRYLQSEKTPLEPIKPSRKVEYVKVECSVFTLKDDFDNGMLFGKSNGMFYAITSEHRMANLVCHDALYRKVETEITREEQLYSECEESIKAYTGLSYITIGESKTIRELINSGNIK